MWVFLESYLPRLLLAIPTTLALWALAISIGMILCVPITIGRIYGPQLLSKAIGAWINIIRGTPMLIQMFFIYFGLPEVGLVFDPFTAAVLAIGVNSAAYQAEYLRAGIQAIPQSQMIAARSIGLSRPHAIVAILLPQAFRNMLPAWSNELVVELQFSSIAFTIGVLELTGAAEKIGYETFRFFDAFLLCGVLYAILTGILILALRILRNRLAVPGMGAASAT